jgi:hypothetical protein
MGSVRKGRLLPTTAQDDLFLLDRCLTPAERRRLLKATRSKKTGHAAPPGTGPEGETCGSCEHLFRNSMARTYFKCLLRRSTWTGGFGTDVRVRDPACKHWEAKKIGEAS